MVQFTAWNIESVLDIVPGDVVSSAVLATGAAVHQASALFCGAMPYLVASSHGMLDCGEKAHGSFMVRRRETALYCER